MHRKGGQLQISFGMIFSIILIIAVIAVAFYVIQYFVKLSTCSSIGLFHEALQEEIDTAWQGSSSRTIFDGRVPASVRYICFGNMSSLPSTEADREIFDELKKRHLRSNSNVFVYPQKECGQGINDRELNHVTMQQFFCIRQNDDAIRVSLTKEATQALVRVSKP